MTGEEKAMLLAFLKVDLGITASIYDARLTQLVEVAYDQIRAEGATTLSAQNLTDQQLIVMYAGWLWRRRDSMSGMPRMIRYAINNRVFSEKMGGSNG